MAAFGHDSYLPTDFDDDNPIKRLHENISLEPMLNTVRLRELRIQKNSVTRDDYLWDLGFFQQTDEFFNL